MSGTRAADRPDGALLAPVRDEQRRLDPAVRSAMERALGSPFGDVVVHTGSASNAVAGDLDAAAFTVGRHIVFGAGRYDPGSLRGRTLLAHELTHVIQQRRGGGDPDAGEHRPAAALPLLSGHSEGNAGTAARAALGGGTALVGATGTGVARQQKSEEETAWAALKKRAAAAVRDKLVDTMTDVEAGASYLGGVVDAVSWIPYAKMDLADKAIDVVSDLTGASESSRKLAHEVVTPVAVPEALALRASRTLATSAEIADPVTGNPSLGIGVGKLGDLGEEGINAVLGTEPDEGYFTTRELQLIAKTIGIDVALSFVAVEEIVLALKVVGGASAGKAIYDAVMADPKGFYASRAFWVAVAQAFLYLVGLRAARLQQKIVTLVADVLSTGLTLVNLSIQLGEDILKPDSPDRTKAIKADLKALGQAIAAAIRQFVTHNRAQKKTTGGSQKHSDEPMPSATKNAAPQPPAALPEATPAQQRGKSPAQPSAEAPSTPKPKPSAAPVAAAGPSAPKQAATIPKPAKAPTTEAAAPATKHLGDEFPAAKPKPAAEPEPKLTPSRAKEKAEAGERMRQRAQEKLDGAKEAETKAGTALTTAEQRKAAAEAAISTREEQGKSPTKAQQNELRIADEKLAAAKHALIGAQAAKEAATGGLDTATTDAASRSAAYADAQQRAADKRSSPKKADETKPRKAAEPATSKAAAEEIIRKASELRKRAVDDPAAAWDLEKLYQSAPDDVLKKMAKSTDLSDGGRVANEIERRERARGLDEARKITSDEVEPRRLPHEATVHVTNDDGSQVFIAADDPNRKPGGPVILGSARKELKSGGVDPKRRNEVGFREANNEVHTEAKAVQLPLRKGQTMTILGQYDPCVSCQGRMQAKANATGATVVYWWPGGPKDGMVFKPKGSPQ